MAHNRFPNLGIRQRDLEPPGNLTLEANGVWLQNFHRTGKTDSWRAQRKSCVYQDPGERSSGPTRHAARCACECPEVSCGSVSQQWPATESEALPTTVLGASACWHTSFWRRSPLPPLLLTQFGLRPNYREGTQPHPSQKVGLKMYWAQSCPPEQDPAFPIANSFHQEASTSLLYSSIRRRQNGNHNHKN